MIQYTVYDTATGEIHWTGNCLESELEHLYVPPGGAVLQAASEPGRQRVQAGTVVDLPDPPSPIHVFDYTQNAWVDPRTPESQWEAVRQERNTLLAKSDWTQLPDVPLATKEAWAAYRQALRDITEQPGFPFDVVWPEPPA